MTGAAEVDPFARGRSPQSRGTLGHLGQPLSADRTPVVIAARRTPIGTAGHGLAGVDLVGLLAPVLRALLDDLGRQAPGVDDVMIGNCRGPGGNPARVAALAAGLGLGVPGVTLDRQCGSGQEAVHQAATAVLAGAADLVLAGGAESASTAPWRLARPVTSGGRAVEYDRIEATGLPVPYDRAPFAPSEIGDPDMGPAAEALAALCGVTRTPTPADPTPGPWPRHRPVPSTQSWCRSRALSATSARDGSPRPFCPGCARPSSRGAR